MPDSVGGVVCREGVNKGAKPIALLSLQLVPRQFAGSSGVLVGEIGPSARRPPDFGIAGPWPSADLKRVVPPTHHKSL